MKKQQQSVTRMMPRDNHDIAVKHDVRALVFQAMSAMQGEHLRWENLCQTLDATPPWSVLASSRVAMFEWVDAKGFTLLDLAAYLKTTGAVSAGTALEEWLNNESLKRFEADLNDTYHPTFIGEHHVFHLGVRY